jgi:pantoate--beta-alanine ligase
MLTVKNITQIRQIVSDQKSQGRTVGLVPTMGNLHAGHLSLTKAAVDACDFVICTIFVNPMQFGENEDLESYPRTLSQDIEKLENAGCDCLFHPPEREIYPAGLTLQTTVHVPELGLEYCGKSRPGHFDGVTTVVNKLFNICQPHQAFFGLKDYQQFLIIQRMVNDLQIPVSIKPVEIFREQSGLAMSSRNIYLTDEELKQAPLLFQNLTSTADKLKQGDKNFSQLENAARSSLESVGFTPDYFSICHAETLKPASENDKRLVILAAAFLGKTRLIDNLRLSLT